MVTRESIFRDILRLIVWYPIRAAILFLPHRMGLFLMALMGDIHFFSTRRRHRLLSENLTRIYHRSSDTTSIIREYFRNHYIDRLFIFIFPSFQLKDVEKFIEFQGIEHLKAALSHGSGAVLVHGHFGPVHLPLVALTRMGFALKQIGNPSDEGLSMIGRKVAFRLRLKYEEKIPAEIVKVNGFLRPIFRWLSQNGIVMITGDGTGTEHIIGKSLIGEMWGQKMYIPIGPARLSVTTGAQLLPMFILPGKHKRYRIIIEQAFKTQRTGNEAITELTEKFVHRLEYYISLYPGYMHFLDRFCPDKLIIT